MTKATYGRVYLGSWFRGVRVVVVLVHGHSRRHGDWSGGGELPSNTSTEPREQAGNGQVYLRRLCKPFSSSIPPLYPLNLPKQNHQVPECTSHSDTTAPSP